MADPLYELKNVATKVFFTDLSARKDEYNSVLEVIYDEITHRRDKKVTVYSRLVNQDYREYPSRLVLSFGGVYIQECYDLREKVTLEDIQKEVLTILDDKKIQIYIKYIISNINQIIKKVEALKLNNDLTTHQNIIAEKLQKCIGHLKETYLEIKQSEDNPAPKIQWLGKTNVLATLIYDLWQGQEKGKGIPTKPWINAQKKDLEALLKNNFIDSKGKPLPATTISDYLNTSKPQKRAKKGVRIEL